MRRPRGPQAFEIEQATIATRPPCYGLRRVEPRLDFRQELAGALTIGRAVVERKRQRQDARAATLTM